MNILDHEILAADDVLLVPRKGKLRSRSDAKLRPFIFSAPMASVTGYDMVKAMLDNNELTVMCRYLERDEYMAALRDFHSNPDCYFAVGNLQSCHTLLDQLTELSDQGLLQEDLKLSVAIDIAHGDSVVAEEAIQYLRQQPFIGKIMSGSVATPGGASRSLEWGCTDIRVGIGPGAACTTRVNTGIGIPQLSAVYMVAKEVNGQARVIADGGIKTGGDAVKYLAAGADSIMLGRLLAQTDESSGWIYDTGMEKLGNMLRKVGEPRRYKYYQGQASREFQESKGIQSKAPEGVSSDELQVEGTVGETIERFRGWISSAISYLGLESIDELRPENTQFIKVTPAAYREGTPHMGK